MKRPHEEQARQFCEAIKQLASRAEALGNLEGYLSRHFAEWLKSYATTPEAITGELKAFSTIEF